MADEPEVVLGLQVIAGRRLARDGRRPREEVRTGVLERGPGGRDSGAQVERADERYKARAAESSSSKFGTSAVS